MGAALEANRRLGAGAGRGDAARLEASRDGVLAVVITLLLMEVRVEQVPGRPSPSRCRSWASHRSPGRPGNGSGRAPQLASMGMLPTLCSATYACSGLVRTSATKSVSAARRVSATPVLTPDPVADLHLVAAMKLTMLPTTSPRSTTVRGLVSGSMSAEGRGLTMLIGAGLSGALLEVGVVESDDVPVVVHAMAARAKFLR